MIGFSYLCVLLFITILILYLIKKNIKSSPKKIKLFVTISLIPLVLRYLVLILGVVIEKHSVIYLLRHIIFLNYFSIPLIILAALFIFLRDEKIRFNVNFIFLAMLLVGYVLMIFSNKISVSINNAFGFVLILEQYLVPTLIYLIILASLSVFSLLYVDKPYSNKLGMKLLLLSLVICIVEFILFLGGIKLFPYPIIGELLVLISLSKGLSTFK
ncbi:hypothetical protein [Clostridium septicum]|uniref:Uncharacterized protein n=1 Tax=Clostridium septicum TaxID=1504 RepID=A0A9N7JJM7_CLOSE|nr:hypothetical protein [Clostridium septicum]AYE33708.1 hypothetical protein CP523_04085 [Clostridium septicum]MDU1313757.1 hypothetical protein [Clostridium septicum]QAS61863.1 hypothetical protein EI377_14605 [Clostridium septicum]UEC21681.1 hypothetical protein LK444_04755 [Clostridium septicum]USS00267.1 hypothetical protein NH397_12325 [Clostridium septicum]